MNYSLDTRQVGKKTNTAIYKFSYGPPKHLMSAMKMC